MTEYAVYRGDDFLFVGTAAECANFMGWKNAKQTNWYASPTGLKRAENKKNGEGIFVVKVDVSDLAIGL